MYQRLITSQMNEALADTPVVIVNGPRQSGKTTLVRQFESLGRPYRTLDNPNDLAGARNDPIGFLRGTDQFIIDEVQRVPELFLAIKETVDRNRAPGRFILTGSAEILNLPGIRDSLAGRMQILPLLPLSMNEISGGGVADFLAELFAGEFREQPQKTPRTLLLTPVLAGGFPEMLVRSAEHRRVAWAQAYVEALLRRDVPDISNIEKPEALARLVDVLAVLNGQIVNLQDMGSRAGIDHKTAVRYLGLLENLYLVRRLKPWFRNELKRLVKSSKLHFIDSGLLAGIRGLTTPRIKANPKLFGPLLETFVHAEISKLITFAQDRHRLFHYRDHDGYEVDFVIENRVGQVAGIEVKASATVTAQDFRGLKRLAAGAGRDFVGGCLLYDGERVVRFGDRLAAVPLSALWG